MAYPPQQQQPLTRQQRFDEQDKADQEFANQQQALRIQQQRADADEVGQAMQMKQFGQQSLYQQQQMAEAQRASARADEQAKQQAETYTYTQGRRPVQEEHDRLANVAAQEALINSGLAETRAAQTSKLQAAEGARQAAAEKRLVDAEDLATKQKEASLAYTQAAADKTPDEIKHYYDNNAINAQQAAWLMTLKTPEERRENLANMLDRLNPSKAGAGAPTGTSAFALEDAKRKAEALQQYKTKYPGLDPDINSYAAADFETFYTDLVSSEAKAKKDAEKAAFIQARKSPYTYTPYGTGGAAPFPGY